jgi:hypothetical protein
MNRLPALVAALLALAAPGCFGEAKGTVHPGDVVVVAYEAKETNGTLVASARNVTVVVGEGDSALGPDVEQALVGHRENETVSATTTTYGRQSVVQSRGEPFPAVQDAPTSAIEERLGHTPAVGDSFPTSEGSYNWTVLATDNETTQVELGIPDGATQPFPEYGVALVWHRENGTLHQTIEPLGNDVFHLDADPFTGVTVFDTPPGYYRLAEVRDGRIVFDMNPYAPDFTRQVVVSVTIGHVEHGSFQPVPGEYGHRASPQVHGALPSTAAGTPSGLG